jgi:hypothetical protein
MLLRGSSASTSLALDSNRTVGETGEAAEVGAALVLVMAADEPVVVALFGAARVWLPEDEQAVTRAAMLRAAKTRIALIGLITTEVCQAHQGRTPGRRSQLVTW